MFERHADTPDSGAAPAAELPAVDQAAPAVPAGSTLPGSSATRHRSKGRGLQRRGGQDAASATVEAVSPSAAEAFAESTAKQAVNAAADANVASLKNAPEDTLTVSDVERATPRLLQAILDLHLNLQNGQTAVRARLQVRNGGSEPLSRIVLQVSSSLLWQSARVVSPAGGSQALPLQQHRVTTDVDHTGALSEVVLTLPEPLAAGGVVALDTFYSGLLGSSAERLERLGAPATRAALADWDTVSDTFTGLRGFGNVVWMPAVAVPSLLSSPVDFVGAIDAERLRASVERVALRLTLETDGPVPRTAFFHGLPLSLAEVAGDSGQVSPSAAVSDGASSSVDSSPTDAAEGVRLYTAEWPLALLGTHPASLFVTASQAQTAETDGVRVLTNRTDVSEAYAAAAERVRPMLQEWLGPRPARTLTVVDLPLAGAQPFADGALLVAPLRAEEAKELAPSLVYPLAESWLPAGVAPWLAEGLPEFLRLLYLERTEGRDTALVDLSASGDALAREEALPSAEASALTACVNATCARTKGAYVFSMLRNIAGADALQQALAGWLGSRRPLADGPETTDARSLQRLLESAAGKKLDWFFADWVDRDAGLPDLTIVSVAPRQVERGTVNNTVPSQRRPVGGPIGPEPVPQPGDPAQPEQGTTASRNQIGPRDGSWLIAVEVQNNGGAVAEVPVTVRSGGLQNSLPLRIAAHSRATVRVPFETAPEEVWVNDGTTPEQRIVTHHRTLAGAEGR